MKLVLFMTAILLAGCQRETLTPAVPFTAAHAAAARDAIRAAGFNAPSECGLNEQGYVFAVVDLPSPAADTIGQSAQAAALAMRNAVYVLPGADKNWPYKIRIMGPSPGPGLVSVVGTARFDSAGTTWKPGGF